MIAGCEAFEAFNPISRSYASRISTQVGAWSLVFSHPRTSRSTTAAVKRLVFKKNGNYAAVDKGGKELWAGTFEIDPTATPKVWDHRSHDGKKEGKDVLGIYELDGDSLKVACVVGQWKNKEWVGKGRPKAIDSKQADVVIELKWAK